MITAKFKENVNTLSLRVKGHALSAPEGEDLICAASSILALQAAQMAENLYIQEWLDKKPRISIDKGDVTVIVHPKEEHREMVFNMLQTVAIGYSILESKYPEYVKLTMFGAPKAA